MAHQPALPLNPERRNSASGRWAPQYHLFSAHQRLFLFRHAQLGAFQLYRRKQPDYTIDEGSTTTALVILYDTGVLDGDYSSNENYTFTICPDQPYDCILSPLEYYFIEPQGMFGVTDQLTFFDGAQPSPTNIIGQVGKF